MKKELAKPSILYEIKGGKRQMEEKNEDNYKGFNENLTKEDLDEEELLCYNKLMDGINKASPEEKDEVAHLMEVFLETEEETYTSCARCKKEFTNDSQDLNASPTQTADDKKVYCNKCLKKMWGANIQEE